MLYLPLKFLHVIGATVLLGTGAGIAFFMLMAHLAGEKNGILAVARIVVIADVLFTATAVVLQPATGVVLAWYMGWSPREGWIALSMVRPCSGCADLCRRVRISFRSPTKSWALPNAILASSASRRGPIPSSR